MWYNLAAAQGDAEAIQKQGVCCASHDCEAKSEGAEDG
jgi:hypothetical protein